MKKIAFILLASFLLAGCRENYLAEKAYYQATKTLELVKNQNSASNPELLTPAIAAFEQVAEQYPTTPKAKESLFHISLLKAGQKDFDGARAALEKIIPIFGDVTAAEASFRIGQMYELENRWEEAEKQYWKTAENYSTQLKGLYCPLYILIHYKQTKDTAKQAGAYQLAVGHYRALLDKVGPISVSAAIKNYLALTYLTHDEWEKARAEWISIADQYPDSSAYAPLALLTASELSVKNKKTAQGIKDYERFMAQYPKDSFSGRQALGGRTAVRLGILYESQNQHAKAREWFNKAQNQYFKDNPAGVADIQLLIGKSYQVEGDWEKADKIYSELESKSPSTTAALQVPFLRYLHFKETGEIDQGYKILDEAIAKYKKLVEEQPNSKMAVYAKQFMLSAYTQKKDWNQLMQEVDQELQKETRPDRKGRWLFLKALIAENRMKDKAQAASIYQDFLTQFPGHPLSDLAKSHQEIISKAS